MCKIMSQARGQTLNNVSCRGVRANQGIFLQKSGSNNDFMCGTVLNGRTVYFFAVIDFNRDV